MPESIPVPPESLRVAVGPFANEDLFRSSGEWTVADIADLCGLGHDDRVLEIGCGCGRLARSLVPRLAPEGRYEGFDVAQEPVQWCRRNIASRAANFHFRWVDVQAGGHNPDGAIPSAAFRFPYPDRAFDLVIVASVFTHMRADGIERYLRETARVLKPGGRCFVTALLFDRAAERAVAERTTIFDFRHAIGPCLTFDPACPEEGIAFREEWFSDVLREAGLEIETVRRGNWRTKRSYEISHDHIAVRKGAVDP
jgi:ubiquinone/menaquinone biosynthesis C-methylase UbiE